MVQTGHFRKLTFSINSLILVINLACSLPADWKTATEDPELTAGYFEGDILLDGNQRNGLRSDEYRWPNNLVPYKFFTELGNK